MTQIINSTIKLTLCIICILISSCSQHIDQIEDAVPMENKLSFYKMQRTMHNAFLSNLENHLSDSVASRNDISCIVNIDSIHAINIRYVESLDLNDNDKNLLITDLNLHKKYYELDALKEDLFPNNSIDSIFETYNHLAHEKVINEFDLNLIKELTIITYNNFYNIDTNEDFSANVNQICKKWETHYSSKIININDYDTPSPFVGSILAITQSSTEWWAQSDLMDLPDDSSVIA